MDSLYDIEDSLDEIQVKKSIFSETVVDDSFGGNDISPVSSKINQSDFFTPKHHKSFMSSDDEDINFKSVARTARRIRRIASDSDESDPEQMPPVNDSLSHRRSKLLDSEEDDSEDSGSSETEPTDSFELQDEIGDESLNKTTQSSECASVYLQKEKKMLDESLNSSEKKKSKCRAPRRDISFESSDDEDVNLKPTAKSTFRIGKIISDSEDEFKPGPHSPAVNDSFTHHRSKHLDSEDDSDGSVFSETEQTDSHQLQVEAVVENSIKNMDFSTDLTESYSLQDEINVENITKNVSSSECASVSVHEERVKPEVNTVKEQSLESDESCEIVGNNESVPDLVIVSSGSEDSIEEKIKLKPQQEFNTGTKPKLLQPKLESLVQKMSLTGTEDANDGNNNIFCTAAQYANQSSKISNLRTDLLRCKNILRSTNLSSLPDNGALLLARQRKLEAQLSIEEETLKKMVVDVENEPKTTKSSWEQLQKNSNYVVPNTFGKTAMNTFTTQKTLTMDRLKNLHDSLATCPDESTLAEDPKGIKVELMRHQKRALAWLMWREGQKPAGGVLADDMGLGKTLTMISLVLATKEEDLEDRDSESESEEKENKKWIDKNSRYKVEGGTLVVCPATLIRQWEREVETKLKRHLLSTELYHGTGRETKITRLAKYDIVITTYKLVQGEFEKKGPLFNIKWKRVILDEAHVIRNPKSLTSLAVCDLKAKARWALTGTPVHNKELDLYALLKFLRCSPFDDLNVWKRWVANKNAGGQDRLNTVITSILLRRTKDQLQNEGALNSLPEKRFEVIEVTLDSSEKKIYQNMLAFSRTMFIQFLRQRAEKNPEFTNVYGGSLTETNDEEYNKMHKKVMQIHGNKEVKSHEILVLLLRLRQICCHPSLISTMLDRDNCDAEGIEDDGVDIDILDKLNNLNIEDEPQNPQNPAPDEEKASFAAHANKLLSSSNPVFAEDRANEKLRVMQKIVEERVIPNGDKIIIVSQWTTMLNIIMRHLRQAKIKCDLLDGKVPVHKRNDIVENFNNPASKTKVLLLSLTAGGVGLNLVGANHLLLVDLHWNPQLESQAQDRIYRVGQKKPVHVYKIVTSDSIEERIKNLQDKKLSMASDILSGVRPGAGSKLSLDDLKMLFNVGA